MANYAEGRGTLSNLRVSLQVLAANTILKLPALPCQVESQTTKPVLARRIRYHQDLYPSVEVVIIPDSGHDMFWDNPLDSIAEVRDFLGK